MGRTRVRFAVWHMMILVAGSAVLSAAVLLVSRTTEASRLSACRRNLQQLSLSLSNYADVYGAFPAGTVANDRLAPERRLSWLVLAWAFLEQWHWLLDQAQPWDSAANLQTRGHGVQEAPQAIGRVALLACPSAPGSSDEHKPGWTWYVGVAGVGLDAPALPLGHPRAGVLGYDRRTRPADIKDGLSNTLVVAETGVGNGPWTAGGASTLRGLDQGRRPYVGRGRQFGGTHGGGVMATFADGSVRFLRETIDPETLEALATAAGGERLPTDWGQ